MNKILKALLLTVAGALVVSLLKEKQTPLAVTLLSVLVVHLGIIWARKRDLGIVFEEAFYLTTFAVIGFLTESWGTKNGHWTYHHLHDGQTVPYWVPLAWAIASVMLGKVEVFLKQSEFRKDKPNALPVRIGYLYMLGMALPLAGESICINLGVWEYHWPLKVLGVPLLALVLIAYTHLVFSLIRAGGYTVWRESHSFNRHVKVDA